MGAVVSGTPIIGTACAITVKARNFEYKTGGNEVQLLPYLIYLLHNQWKDRPYFQLDHIPILKKLIEGTFP